MWGLLWEAPQKLPYWNLNFHPPEVFHRKMIEIADWSFATIFWAVIKTAITFPRKRATYSTEKIVWLKYPFLEVFLCSWIHAYVLYFYKKINKKPLLNIQNDVSAEWLKIIVNPHFHREENNKERKKKLRPNCVRRSQLRLWRFYHLVWQTFSKAATSVLRPRIVQTVGRSRAVHPLTLLDTGPSSLKFLTHWNHWNSLKLY